MRTDRRKDLYRTKRDSFEGPHEEAKIQRKALRRGKNLAISEDTCLVKGKSAVEGDPKKSCSGIEKKGALIRTGGDPPRRTRPHICSD